MELNTCVQKIPFYSVLVGVAFCFTRSLKTIEYFYLWRLFLPNEEGTVMEVKFLRSWLLSFAFFIVCAIGSAGITVASEGFRLSQTCAGCHGTAGASPGNTIPIIGGQDAAYLADAMRAYKTGEREFYVMNIIANAFSDTQIAQISDWFSMQSWVDTTTPNRSSLAASASSIATRKCVECHGRSGKGGDLGPRLAGQPVAYLAKVLREYKAGRRTNVNAAQMMIVRDLSDNEIESLAHYYSRLR